MYPNERTTTRRPWYEAIEPPTVRSFLATTLPPVSAQDSTDSSHESARRGAIPRALGPGKVILHPTFLFPSTMGHGTAIGLRQEIGDSLMPAENSSIFPRNTHRNKNRSELQGDTLKRLLVVVTSSMAQRRLK